MFAKSACIGVGELLEVLESDRATGIHRIAVALRLDRLAVEPPTGDVAAAVFDLLERAQVGAVVLHCGDALLQSEQFAAADFEDGASGFAPVALRSLATGRALLVASGLFVVSPAAVGAVVWARPERLLATPARSRALASLGVVKWFPAR